MPVVKADSYGHGANEVTAALVGEGAKRFAVAAPDEALALRENGIDEKILLLGAAPIGRVRELCQARVTLAVSSLEDAAAYAAAAGMEPLTLHIKLDTGMSRLGLPADEAARSAIAIARLPGVTVEGIFTHFAVADEPDGEEFTKRQFKIFKEITDRLESEGLKLIKHCANSAGVMYHPYTHEDMTRPGLMLYGSDPMPGRSDGVLKPALTWRASIVRVGEIKQGVTVGYGRTWTAPEPRRIATVAVGYADGLHRRLSGSGWFMILRGKKAPLVGRVCMDMCMIDVTDIPEARARDAVTLLGGDGELVMTADDMAAYIGTIPHEVMCSISKRVPRYYTRSR
jgi:alanine racemase